MFMIAWPEVPNKGALGRSRFRAAPGWNIQRPDDGGYGESLAIICRMGIARVPIGGGRLLPTSSGTLADPKTAGYPLSRD